MFYYLKSFNYITFFNFSVDTSTVDLCDPNPCGPNGKCEISATDDLEVICTCDPGYFGIPCRPECTVSSDCPMDLSCVNLKCIDPCPGSCGINAECTVVSHNPVCICADGYTGDPFSHCFEKGKTLK